MSKPKHHYPHAPRTITIQFVNNVLIGHEQGHEFAPIKINENRYLLPVTICSHDTPAQIRDHCNAQVMRIRKIPAFENALIHGA